MSKKTLIRLWRRAYDEIEPKRLILPLILKSRRQNRGETAILFWGKSAAPSFEAYRAAKALPRVFLVISPDPPRPGFEGRWIQAEHPLPGDGSFRAGLRLLDFFAALPRYGITHLDVHLSGGASSLAWLPKSGMSRAALGAKLARLYAQPLTIRELNRARSQLCQLKRGGAARWLAMLAPDVRARVFLINDTLSDTLPGGADVVGSAPFYTASVPHKILADNSSLVAALVRAARAEGLAVLGARSGWSAEWEQWVSRALGDARAALAAGRSGVFVYGGEPRLRLPLRHGRGGRQTQIAAALAASPEVAAGKLEVLAMSSDGCDGGAGAAGAYVGRELAARASARQLRNAAVHFDSATVLGEHGALIYTKDAARSGFSNVQDVLLISV